MKLTQYDTHSIRIQETWKGGMRSLVEWPVTGGIKRVYGEGTTSQATLTHTPCPPAFAHSPLEQPVLLLAAAIYGCFRVRPSIIRRKD